MEFQIVYFILLISSAILAIQLALINRKHHKLSFILLMIAIAVWSLGYAVELNSTKISTKLFWIKIQYFGILLAPLSWSIFVFQYLGKENLLTKKNLFLISAIPTITIFLVWTNDFHHLIWKNFNIIYYESFSLIDFEYGIWANLNAAYLYLLTLFAIFLLLRMLIYSYHFYQKQAGFLLISAFTPLIGNAIYVFNISPIDVTPFTFLISGIALGISFSRFRLLDVRPIAIETLIENMRDGVIAIDRYNRIVVANPSAQKIIGSKLVGKFANELLKFHPNMLDYCKSESEIKKK